MLAIKLSSFLLALCLTGIATGSVVQVGDLSGPNTLHDVTGLVRFISPTTIVISGFSFDGMAPDTFLYFYGPGQAVTSSGGGTIIPVQGEFTTEEGGFKQSFPLKNIELRVELSPSMSVCGIGTLTVWCRTAMAIFARLPVSTTAFETMDPCSLSSSRVILGELSSATVGVTGTVQFTSPTTIVLENFNFDGSEPDTFLYMFPPGMPSNGSLEGGMILPVQAAFANAEGGFNESHTITNENITIRLNKTSACGIGSIAFVSRTKSTPFSEVLVPSGSYSNKFNQVCLLEVELLSRVVAGELPRGDQLGIGGLVQFTSPTSIFIQGFTFDGTSVQDTFLYYFGPGEMVNASGNGTILPIQGEIANTEGGFIASRVVPEMDIYIELPTSATVCDIGTLVVWSRAGLQVLSQLPIAPSLLVSSGDDCRLNTGVVIAGHLTGTHSITGAVRIISSTSLLLENFNFDGQPPDTFLYGYAPGQAVDENGGGFIIPLPQGNGIDVDGGFVQSHEVSGANIVIELGAGMDVCDIGTITLWCRFAKVIFAQLEISRDLFVNEGQDPCTLTTQASNSTTTIIGPVFDNCYPLDNSLQVSWTVDRPNSLINFRLCGCEAVDPNIPQYLSFGLSGSKSFTSMDGADTTVVWVDGARVPQAVDYHLRANKRFQCRSGLGVCPDEVDARGNCTNDVFNVSGVVFNRKQCVSFSRPLNSTNDMDCDLPIDPDNKKQYIVWAVGGLGATAFKHFSRASYGDEPIHLGREPLNQCLNQDLVCKSCDVFNGKTVVARQDTTFNVQIGPSGNERGYMAIAGRAGWGIAWYVDSVLVPELVVERGRTYTFIVEGGNDETHLGNYHPFYITDSIQGGRLRNSDEEKRSETVYAGFDENDRPTGVGRLCELTESPEAKLTRERCGSFETYLRQLADPQCSSGEPATITWTPDENTPDTVYYQCATHINLGYKITVMDSSSSGASAISHDLIVILVLVASSVLAAIFSVTS